MAASTAWPPRCTIANPAWDARWWGQTTIPVVAVAMGRDGYRVIASGESVGLVFLFLLIPEFAIGFYGFLKLSQDVLKPGLGGGGRGRNFVDLVAYLAADGAQIDCAARDVTSDMDAAVASVDGVVLVHNW